MHFIYALPSNGAQLWQGGKSDIIEARNQGIRHVTLASWEYQPDSIEGMTCLGGSFRDVGSLEPAELEETKATAARLADWLHARMLEGKNVISTCRHGLNRSGLVSALVLRRATTWTPDEIIAYIREKRGNWALNNDLFVRIVKGAA